MNPEGVTEPSAALSGLVLLRPLCRGSTPACILVAPLGLSGTAIFLFQGLKHVFQSWKYVFQGLKLMFQSLKLSWLTFVLLEDNC